MTDKTTSLNTKENTMIDIDNLTIKQARELASMFGGAKETKLAPSGRAVVVVDRGWIFAGDMSATLDGYLRLTNAVHVFRWEAIGFARVIEDWRSDKVDLRPVADVEIPMDAVIFRVPVSSDWGRK